MGYHKGFQDKILFIHPKINVVSVPLNPRVLGNQTHEHSETTFACRPWD